MSSKRRHKNSMKCAIAKFLNQDGRPDRYWKLKRMMENSAKNQTQPEIQTSLSLTPEETQKRLKRTKPRVVSYPKGCPGRPKGDRKPDGGLPEVLETA